MTKKKEKEKLFTYVPKTDEQLKELAKDIWSGKVFTSNQVQNHNDLHIVFLPLVFMTEKQTSQLKKDKITLLYGHIKHALPRSVNGMPTFGSMGMLNESDHRKLVEIYDRIEKTMKSI